MRNRWKQMLVTVLAVVLMLGSTMQVMAAEPQKYPYQIRFFAGNHGTFENGTAEIVNKDIPAGASLSFTAQTAVTLEENSKYYVKGVRLSGRDNADVMASLTIDRVEKDADYVVVYGVRGNQVNYTVKYQDAKGKELAPDDVFYGNVGDKPVVAYKYISGYRPQALGMTKTLSENEAENVFTFVYVKAATGGGGTTYVDGPTTIIYQDRYVPGAGTATGTGADDEGGQEGGAAVTPGGEGASGEESSTPQEIVDLDDEETPLGNIDAEGDKANLPMAGMLTLLGVCVAALAALAVLLIKLKKRGKEEAKEASQKTEE